MGQKFSELKSILKTMEEKHNNEQEVSVGRVSNSTNESSSSSSGSSAKNDTNGNAEPLAELEGAYNINEVPRVEDNGNLSIPSTSDCNGASNYCPSSPNENVKLFPRKVKSRNRKKNKKDWKKKRSHWVVRFNCARVNSGSGSSGGSSELEGGESSSGSEIVRWDEDCDEAARIERAREIAEGMEPPPGYRPNIRLLCPQDMILDSLTALLHSAALSAFSQIDNHHGHNAITPVHTQVDYIHCLVPDLLEITSSSFYWGKMDRYEAEGLLDGKPEGTFLLRDSAQEEYLFSVSFRKYGRSLHARIEQWKHMFSFDCHDPGVYSAPTVCGLIHHYKDPSVCMFFEPMLTLPLHRTFSFPLQHLCRAVICSKISYDGIAQLKLPKLLKTYLKEYHYKQRVKVRVFDSE